MDIVFTIVQFPTIKHTSRGQYPTCKLINAFISKHTFVDLQDVLKTSSVWQFFVFQDVLKKATARHALKTSKAVSGGVL